MAYQLAPETSVVYVDIDPMVVTHGRAMLAHTDSATIIQADLRDPEGILDHPETRRLLDLDQPVAILLVSVLHFVTDAEDPYGIVARLRDATPSGSYLVLSHGAPDDVSPEVKAAVERVYATTNASGTWRTRAEIERFFDGYNLVEPGLVHGSGRWRSDQPEASPRQHPLGYAGIGLKT